MTTKTSLTVRYAETDQMGIVHHSVYPIWFEAARTDFLKQAGMSYSAMEASGLMTPLVEMHCRFKAPARYEDEVTVETRLEKMTYAKLVFAYKVHRNHDHRLLAEGSTIHACTDRSLKPVNVAKSFPELYTAINSLAEKE